MGVLLDLADGERVGFLDGPVGRVVDAPKVVVGFLEGTLEENFVGFLVVAA